MNSDKTRWESVFSTDQEYKAIIITELLADNDIVSHYLNKKDQNYLFGYFELYVRPDDILKSKLLIEKSNL